jgi:hypothetical protein
LVLFDIYNVKKPTDFCGCVPCCCSVRSHLADLGSVGNFERKAVSRVCVPFAIQVA